MRLQIGRRSLAALVMAGLIGAVTSGNAQETAARDAGRLPCSDCHLCQSPTTAEPCLKICLRSGEKPSNGHTAAEGPGVTILDQLQDLYKPVRFQHKLHAEMVGMGQGCPTCHHYSPPGKFPPCKECHGERSSNPSNLRQPGLKGAYHRQCMGCHREWSHDTKCVVCHEPSNHLDLSAVLPDTTDIIGTPHPIITEPHTKSYYTPYDQGPVVTFYHKQHIDLFGLRCTDCHRQENCGFCHDLERPLHLVKSMEEVHAICNDCHEEDRCGKCHGHEAKPQFSHASTGWALGRFHERLDCRACHPTGQRIARLNSMCSGCHGGWNQENFSHAVTGMQLDETHRVMDCEDCHTDRQYRAAPSCADCHDDGRTATTTPPGTRLRWPGR